MDPKMDSGCLDAKHSLEDDYDVSRPLLPAEVIGIIDQLLCLEVNHDLKYSPGSGPLSGLQRSKCGEY